MIQQMIKAILFDMDGTLLDTKEYIFQAFEHTLKQHNVLGVPRTAFDLLQGHSLEECYRRLAPGHEYAPLQLAHRTFQRDNMDLVAPFRNTLSTLTQLKEAGMKLGVVSTRAQTAHDSLRQAGIFEMLDAIITGDDIKEFKPHPEGIFKALNQIGVGVEGAIMVGDTEADIMAGKNAKTMSVGVTYGFTPRAAMLELNPDYLIDDIQEVLELVQ